MQQQLGTTQGSPRVLSKLPQCQLLHLQVPLPVANMSLVAPCSGTAKGVNLALQARTRQTLL